MAGKKITDADLQLLLKLKKDGGRGSDYIFENLHRQGFDIPDSLLSYYKDTTPTFDSFLKNKDIDPTSTLGILMKTKWKMGDKPYIKEYPKLDEGRFTIGKGAAAPDTVHLEEGNVDDFIKHTPYQKDGIEWDKRYEEIKKDFKENVGQKGYLQIAKDWLGL